VRPGSRKEWRAWLRVHHRTSTGVWLVQAKKHTGIPSLTWQEAVEEALCFGWIDSIRHPVDDTYYKQWFTPRNPKSNWSAINKKAVARLIKAGLVTAVGLAAVAAAKRSGTWNTWTSTDALTIPPELRRALAANKQAKRNWDALTPAVRRGYLRYVSDAKREETRTQRIAIIINRTATRST